jgi:hypothetical protein
MNIFQNRKRFVFIVLILLLIAIEVIIYYTTKQEVDLNEKSDIKKEELKETDESKNTSENMGCPNGYVAVNKNSNNSYFFDKKDSILSGKDYFCVMAYEAKCDIDNDKIGDYPKEESLPRGQSFNWNECKLAVSSLEGAPIVNISQKAASNVCSSFGDGYHLITNDEWMAIARDVEKVQQNWYENSLFRGNSDNDYVVSDSDNPTDSVNSRYFYLSNGNIVWDMAGNVWEWNADIIKRKDQPPYSGWYEVNQLGNYGLIGEENIASSDINQSSINGLGKLFLNYLPDSDEERAFLRGGSWGDKERAGIYTLDFLNSPYDYHEYIGFRCAKIY